MRNSQPTVFFVAIFMVLLGLVGVGRYYLGMSNSKEATSNCEFSECPQSNFKISQFILAEGLSKIDGRGNTVPGTRGNVYVNLPEGTTSNGKQIFLNDRGYDVAVNLIVGLCPMVAGEEVCTYTDKETKRGDTLRMWKNEGGIFALNLIPTQVDGYPVDSIVVTALESNKPFTESEIIQWEHIFETLSSEQELK